MGRAKTFYEDTSYSFAIAVTFSLWLLFWRSERSIFTRYFFLYNSYSFVSLQIYKYFDTCYRKVISVFLEVRHSLLETHDVPSLKNYTRVLLFCTKLSPNTVRCFFSRHRAWSFP
jgi:hypothetical protein